MILSSYNVKTTMNVDQIINLIKSKSKEDDLKEKLSNVEYINSVLSEYYPPLLIAKQDSFKRSSIKQNTMLPKIVHKEKPAPFKKANTEKSFKTNISRLDSSSNKDSSNKVNEEESDHDSNKMLTILSNPELSCKNLKEIENWDFNILTITNPEDKCLVAWNILEMMRFRDLQPIQKEIFSDFISVVYSKYSHNQNPYHNFDHAITVQHALYFLIKRKPELFDSFDDYDLFSFVIAGLVHDIDHTGKNNSFECASLSKYSIRYNDESVLENHHCSTFFKILLDQRLNILEKFDREEFLYCRGIIIHCILSTDMKSHFDIGKKFEIKINEFNDKKETLQNLSNKKLILGMLIHTSDIYGPAKPNEIAIEWNNLLNQEFMKQVDEENELGLPVTVFMKDLDKVHIRAKQEFNFINFIVQPNWELLNKFYSGALDDIIDNCKSNQAYWDKYLKIEETEKEK